jgi:hypothetical protein
MILEKPSLSSDKTLTRYLSKYCHTTPLFPNPFASSRNTLRFQPLPEGRRKVVSAKPFPVKNERFVAQWLQAISVLIYI